jgi:hypothetical protein
MRPVTRKLRQNAKGIINRYVDDFDYLGIPAYVQHLFHKHHNNKVSHEYYTLVNITNTNELVCIINTDVTDLLAPEQEPIHSCPSLLEIPCSRNDLTNINFRPYYFF